MASQTRARVRQCLDCRTPTTNTTRCTACARTKERARVAKRGDRYTHPTYKAARAKLEQQVPIYGYRCWRCGRYEAPDSPKVLDRKAWHCDHVPWSSEANPVFKACHARCNSGHRGGETYTPPTTPERTR